MNNPAASLSFTIFPAIDLRHGKVVRLAQGDPDRQTVYGDDPLALAECWKAEGAAWLHVVNLDGAFGSESAANRAALQRILRLGLKVQLGGGLRDRDSIRAALDAGVSRAVIGTAAIENPSLVDWALETFGAERVAVGIDARDGLVRIKGWAESTSIQAIDLGKDLHGARPGVVYLHRYFPRRPANRRKPACHNQAGGCQRAAGDRFGRRGLGRGGAPPPRRRAGRRHHRACPL